MKRNTNWLNKTNNENYHEIVTNYEDAITDIKNTIQKATQ